MNEAALTKARRLLLAGSVCGAAASVLLPYGALAGILFFAAALLWAAAGRIARQIRPEFGASVKYSAIFGVLMLVSGLLPDASLAALLGIGAAALAYFSAVLLGSGLRAALTGCSEGGRAAPPPAASHFEYCAGAFALGRIAVLAAPGLDSIADVVSMSALLIGFVGLARYFGAEWKDEMPENGSEGEKDESRPD